MAEAATAVVPGLWIVPLGAVNAYLHEGGDGLTVIDTGYAHSEAKLAAAIRAIGRQPTDVRQIIATHAHVDHVGSLAALKRLTNAPALMHPVDAAMTRVGDAYRPLRPSPGIVNGLIGRLILWTSARTVEPAAVDREVADGEVLPGGLRAIHAPGHCAGQVVLHWPEHGGVLVAADAAAHVIGLAPSPAYEDLALGLRTLARLAALDFEVAVFGHGRPIRAGASARFRAKFA